MKTNILWPTLLLYLMTLLGCKSNTQKAPVAVDYLFHHEIRQPALPVSKATPTLLLLHGYGSNEKDLLSLAQHMDPRVMVICPRAPITLAEGRYSWYSLNRQSDEWKYNVAEVIVAKDQLLSYLDQLQLGMGISKENIYVGGFSQGAIMSLTAGLMNPNKLAGIISLSGELYPEIALKISKASTLKDLKVFISHGLQDQVLLPGPMKKTAALLEEKGVNVSQHWYPSKHTISNDNFKDLLTWIGQKMLKVNN